VSVAHRRGRVAGAPPTRTYRAAVLRPDRPHPAPATLPTLAPVPWGALFGNDRPVEVELGCGRGAFLAAAAIATPERNFFGIERAAGLARAAWAALAATAVTNARVLAADGRCVVLHLVPPRSVSAYHLYFPDPWWKRRHHRRRLVDPAMAEALARTLVPGGRVHLATDVAGLYDAIAAELASAGLRAAVADSPAAIPLPTRFAQRCASAGRPVLRAVFLRE
jgi:tRNA (guanine-N7-)-methyltransferase